MQFEYTGDQKRLEAALDSFMRQDEVVEFAIVGYAGTGKTTVSVDLLSRYLGKGRGEIVMCGPTNKATKVIRDLVEDKGLDFSVCTIFSLLGVRPNDNSELKAFTLGDAFTNLSDIQVVQIDEASMLNDYMLSVISKYQKRFPRVKWIYMGDPQQLRPVKQEYRSKAFDVPHKVELTEIVRQADGSPTAILSRDVRNYAEAGIFPEFRDILPTGEHSGEVLLLSPRQWREALLDMVRSEGYAHNRNYCRAIAWTNAAVNGINDMVRAELYPGLLDPFVVQENVLTAQPIRDKDQTEKFVAHTDDEFVVEQIIRRIEPRYEVEIFDLTLIDSDGLPVHAYVPTPVGRVLLNSTLETLSRKAKQGERYLWGTFWAMKEYFDDIRPCHALTSHRAQGSTYLSSFVNAEDIMKNRNFEEMMESLYVATTRSRTNCYIRT